MALPHHIALIPDGNRRWAKSRGLVPWEGHKVGGERFRDVISATFETDIPYVTFWAASQDNLTKRSPVEVEFLLGVLRSELQREAEKKWLTKEKINFRVFGKWREIIKDKEIHALIDQLEKESEEFHDRHLTVLLAYDGRTEMLEVLSKLQKETSDQVDAETLQKALWTGHLPPVDFVVRTGGDPHWSAGFMMWHTANSQLYFTETLWPDFGKEELTKALAEYARRERRFGK
jgi:undecaprenyl diphosphate synthase